MSPFPPSLSVDDIGTPSYYMRREEDIILTSISYLYFFFFSECLLKGGQSV